MGKRGPKAPTAETIQILSDLLAQGKTREDICKEMKIGKTKYHKLLDMMEETMMNWSIAMADHGLLINFKSAYDRIRARGPIIKNLLDKALNDKNPWVQIHALRLADEHDQLEINLLNDAKIIRQFRKMFQDLQATPKKQAQEQKLVV